MAKNWKSWSTVEGDTIHEWALQTSNHERLSQAAADQLFGTGTLSTSSDDPVYYPDKGSSYTYDFNVQSGGFTTRLDVFSNWGKGVDGFSPHSFQPTKLNESAGKYMNVQNPVTGRWAKSYSDIYAWYKLSYPTLSKAARFTPHLRAGRFG